MKASNTVKDSPRTGSPQTVERVVRTLREGALIGLVAVCAYLLMALISYSELDPGWSKTGSGGRVINAGGPTGAWLADVFFSLFGYLAYLFPTLLAYRAWLVFRERARSQVMDWILLGLRIVGFFLVMVAGSGLAGMHFVAEASMPFASGGLLGASVASGVTEAFSYRGGTLLLLSVFLFGLTIFTDLSWFKLMDELGRLALLLWDKTSSAIQQYLSKRREQRKVEKVVKERKKERKIAIEKQVGITAKRTPPKISPPTPKPTVSARIEKEKQQVLFDAPVVGELPHLDLLDPADKSNSKGYSTESLEAMSRLLELKLKDFNIVAEVVSVLPGPVVTRFEMQPAPGIKASRITGLAKDLARSLAVVSVRVVEVIPGKSVIGIEIPNEHREIVRMSEVVSCEVFDAAKSPLTVVLGHDIGGEPVTADIAKMPHLLVAGTTGSGKSVGVNVMLLSLLYKATPEDLRLILVDPKVVELQIYQGIPHLLTPVITDMQGEAPNALRWSVGEMERRYKLLAALGVRNIAGFNRKVVDAIKAGEPLIDPLWSPDETIAVDVADQVPPTLSKLPFIVIVIDEFADMMMASDKKKIETLISRITQKARAAGIHLILATQRPSVDVITGLIKANVPTRMAFQVSSKTDSRTILDQGGAEQLLGHGDMLFLPPGSSLPVRVHGAFVDDHEVENVVEDWKKRGKPDYIDGVVDDDAGAGVLGFAEMGGADEGDDDPEADALYDEAVAFVLKTRKPSISSVQRKLRIGYNRAARLIEAMEAAGLISEMGSNGQRDVLAPGGH